MRDETRRARGRARALRVVALLAVAVGGTRVEAQNVQAEWVFPGSGKWSQPENWSTNPAIPNNTGTLAYDVDLDANVELDLNVQIDNLSLSGNLEGLHDLVVRQRFDWLGGTLYNGAANTFTANGGINIDGSGSRYLYANLELGGLTTWRNVDMDGGGDARTITNRADGVFEILGNVSLEAAHQSRFHFRNLGELRISTSGRAFFANTDLKNDGRLNVLTGEFATALDGDGAVHIASGATLQLYGLGTGTVINRIKSIDGTGKLILESFTAMDRDTVFAGTVDNRGGLQVNANVELVRPVTLGYVEVNGSLTVHEATIDNTITGSGDLVVNGPLVWNVRPSIGGLMTGTGKIIARQGATFVQAPNFGSRTFVNHGNIVVPDGTAGGTIDNQPGARFELPADKPLMSNIINGGTFIKSGGSGVVEVGGVSNSGTFEVRSGGIRVLGGGTSTGAFVFGPGTSLEIGRPGVTSAALGLGEGASFSGPVSMSLRSGVLRADAAVTIPNLTFTGGQIEGAGDLTVAGPFTWTDGTTAGTGKLVLMGTSSIVGRRNINRRIENHGELTWTGTGPLGIARQTPFVNAAGGVFNANADALVGQQFVFFPPTIDNSGTFQKSEGAGTTDVGANFTNAGTVRVRSGKLRFLYTLTNGGTVEVLDAREMAVLGGLNSTGQVAVGRGGTFYAAGGLTELASADVNGRMIVQPTASEPLLFDELRSKVASGRNGGTDGGWSGTGITSSAARTNRLTGLAIIINDGGDGTPIHQESVLGRTLDNDSIIIKYTYNGDANIDGRINADDYFRIDQGFLAQRADPTYRDGDFNYDGRVNADDYFLIDQAFLGQGEPIGGAAALAAVPEPSVAGVLLAGSLLVRRRRRR